MELLRKKTYDTLRASERFLKTDMVYLAKGGFWLTFAHGFSTLMGFMLSIGFANLLTQDAYGIYKYILSIGGIIGIFALSGLSSAITRASAKNKDGTFLKMFWISIRWGTGVTILGAILAAYYFYKGNSTFAIGMLLVGAGAPLIDSLELYGAFLNGKKDFRRSSLYKAGRSLTVSIGILTLLFFTKEPIMLLIGYFFFHIAALAILFKWTTKHHIQNKEIDADALRLAKHGSVMNAFASFAERIDNILVFQFLGPIQLAIYNFAQVIPINLAGFIKNISTLATPKYAIQDKSVAQKALMQKSFKLFLVGFLVVGVYVLFAPFIYETFFPAYIEAIPYSQIYALTILFSGALPVAFLDAHIAIKEKYIATFIAGIQKISILFIGIYFWGLWGLVFARVITKMIAVMISMIAAKKI